MKRTVLMSFTLFVIAISSLLYAQVSKPSIQIPGEKLHLGMTKADVAALFVGTQVIKTTAWPASGISI
jgi:hypothetical protein